MMIHTCERIANQILANQKQRPAVFARFDGMKLQVGTQSLHRTAISRQWRTFWRLKTRRLAAKLDQILPK